MRGGALLLVCLTTAATAWGQAEPAPPEYVPPQLRQPPPPGATLPTRDPNLPPSLEEPPGPRYSQRPAPLPKWRLSVAPRLSFRLGDPPAGLPSLGYGAGLDLTRAFANLRGLRVGAGLGFAFDRFSSDQGDGSHTLTHATLAASLVLDALLAKAYLRPWASLGAGLSIAEYRAPLSMTTLPVDDISVVALVRVAFGLSVLVYEGVEVGLRSQFELTFSTTAYGEPPRTVFSPGVAALALDVGFRF